MLPAGMKRLGAIFLVLLLLANLGCTSVYAEKEEAAFLTEAASETDFQVISPHPYSTVMAGDNIVISTKTPDGIAKVDFFADGSLLGTAEAEPFQYAWNHAPMGQHTVQAVAYNSQDESVGSNEVIFTAVNYDKKVLLADNFDSFSAFDGSGKYGKWTYVSNQGTITGVESPLGTDMVIKQGRSAQVTTTAAGNPLIDAVFPFPSSSVVVSEVSFLAANDQLDRLLVYHRSNAGGSLLSLLR